MFRILTSVVLMVALSYPAMGQKQNEDKPAAGRILLVVTTHGRLGDADQPTGYWMSEVSHAWTRFTDAGYDVTFASPSGGPAPFDPRSYNLDDPDNKRMWSQRKIVDQIGATVSLADVDPAKYDAIYFAGGHGAMWDFPKSESLQKVTRNIYENGGVVAAVCHGPAALVNVKTADGKYLVDGKNLATFTNAEETSSGLTQVVPFLLQSKLEERGATVQTAPNYQKKVVVDGRLVTGQNPASAAGAADAVVDLLQQNAGKKASE